MADQLDIILVAFLFLNIKHFVCDFPFQSDYQVRTKRIYGHPGGIWHSGLHALATMPVFLLLKPAFGVAFVIVAAEFVLHYHIDWVKDRVVTKYDWQPKDRSYWHAFGADQLLHNLTYVGVVAAAI